MKRVIPFNKFRWAAYILSTVVIVGGIGGTLLFKGYNLGVDFKGGLSQEIRVAPPAFRIVNVSNRVITVSISEKEVSYLKAGEAQVVFPRTADQPLDELIRNLERAGDLKVEKLGGDVKTSLLISVKKELDLQKGMVVNHKLAPGEKAAATIATVRGLLGSLPGGVDIQAIGSDVDQTFLVRTDPTAFTRGENTDTSETAAQAVIAALEKQFGAGAVMENQRESLGPQMAQSLASGSIIAIIVALVLMFVYIAIRFRVNYAFSGILALVHDALTTLAFIGIFQVEFNAAVVAALLTIIGYSINDTVVIFDRIRENAILQKGRDLGYVMDLSVTQTLGRTLITSLTVFIAIVPLYIFGTGPVKDFSFAMIFGLITGSYSTIFIASPIALAWQRQVDRAKRRKEIKLYGQVQTPELATVPPSDQLPAPDATDAVPVTAASTDTAPAIEQPTGPVTRIQRVLEKKKKKRHNL